MATICRCLTRSLPCANITGSKETWERKLFSSLFVSMFTWSKFVDRQLSGREEGTERGTKMKLERCNPKTFFVRCFREVLLLERELKAHCHANSRLRNARKTDRKETGLGGREKAVR